VCLCCSGFFSHQTRTYPWTGRPEWSVGVSLRSGERVRTKRLARCALPASPFAADIGALIGFGPDSVQHHRFIAAVKGQYFTNCSPMDGEGML
jgi:hypothetical protein